MYTTTRDRAIIDAQRLDHAETYGTSRELSTLGMWSATGTLSTLYLFASVAGAIWVIAYMVFHILTGDANYCSEVLNSFSGPTDHPAAVNCATQNGSN